MRLINFIREFVEWRRAKRRFSSYIDMKLVRKVLEDPDGMFAPPRVMEIDFVLVLLRDEDLEGIPAQLEASVAVIRKHCGLLLTMEGPIGSAVFGYPRPDPDAASARRACASELGAGVKVLHGRGPALVGFVNRSNVYAHVALFGFGGLLAELAGMQLGEVREKLQAGTPAPQMITPSPPGLRSP